MNIQLITNEALELWHSTMAWFASSSATMDLQTAIICAAVFVISALVVYLISVFGMRERTYEEAIEEQRRRNKEAVQQAKSDKTKKDKKFKKWGKKTKDKSEDDKASPVEEIDEKVLDRTEAKPEQAEASMSSVDAESKLTNPKKKGKRGKSSAGTKDCVQIPSSSEETDEQSSRSNSFSCSQNDSVEANGVQEVVEVNELCQAENDDEKVAEIAEEILAQVQQIKVENTNTESSEAEIKKLSTQQRSPSKKNKRSKSDLSGSNSENVEFSATKVLSFLKLSLLSDEEIHRMLDVLMSKQGGVGGWTKKNDPIPALKKQIQEKEESLEAEQKLLQAANEKLKNLRQELTQEKTRSTATERSLREKVNQQQQEIQNIHGRMQLTHEQHVADLQTKLQQVKTKLNEEHAIAIQRLKEDNSQLQALNRLESEKQQRSNLEVSRVQHELEQLHSAREQYDTHQAAMQQAQDDLHRQTQQLEKHIEQLVSSHQDEEFGYKQRINEMSNKLQQAENARSSLVQELQNAQSVCSSLEADNTTLRQRLDEAKHQINSSEQDLIQLQTRLEDSRQQQRELASCLEQMRSEVMDLTKIKNEQTQQIQNFKQENDSLVLQLAENLERQSADGAEGNQLNGERLDQLETKRARVIEIEEHDKIIQEKEGVLQRLLDELERCKSEILSLAKEIESQKQKNSELQEKYRHTAETLAAVEKKGEEKLQEVVKSAEKNIHEAQRKAEERSKEMQNILNEQIKEVERALQESYSRELEKAREDIEAMQKDADDRIAKAQHVADVRVEEFQESLYSRLAEVNSEAEIKIKEALKCKEQAMSEMQSLCKQEKEALQRIFPDIHINHHLDHSLWIETFEEQAMKSIDKLQENAVSPASCNELKNLKKQLNESLEEKSKLERHVQHYKDVLADTETILNRLQLSAETEEKNWKEELLSKETDLKQMLCENEKLSSEKKALEANLHQLQGLKEMQSELIELQSKLQIEESEKLALVLRFEETLAKLDDLKLKLQAEEREKLLLKSRLEASPTNGSPISLCSDAFVPVNDVNSSTMPIKLEKRKKPRKRGASGKK